MIQKKNENVAVTLTVCTGSFGITQTSIACGLHLQNVKFNVLYIYQLCLTPLSCELCDGGVFFFKSLGTEVQCVLHIAYMYIFLKVRSEDIKYLLNNLLGIVCCASMKNRTQEAYQSVMNVR